MEGDNSRSHWKRMTMVDDGGGGGNNGDGQWMLAVVMVFKNNQNI